jgi:uncharacterized protein YprB with RNaseH-like and TPR domain
VELREKLRLALPPDAARPVPDRVIGPQASNHEHRASRLHTLPVQHIETARGLIHVAEEWWPLDHQHGRLALSDALSLEGPALSRLTPALRTAELADAAFLDVETTGLSGGTGTYVFLVGLGTFEDGAFHLRQFFLADLWGETAMLAAVSEVLESCRALVTFNGRLFDLPLLETRLTLNRLPPAAPGLPHLDLLYPARRLYRRRLPSCRLAALECALLGVEREDDVPGWAIPALYFEYVRRGEARPLRAVFKHNALDILSLVALTAHLGRLWSTLPPEEPDDCLALARWEESEGRAPEATALYEAALESGLDGELRSHARRRLAYLCRRQGRWEDAASLWQEQAGDGGPAGRRLEALVELAKLEEHRRHDYATAEALTRRALSLLEIVSIRDGVNGTCLTQREDLEHRLWRLRRRLAATLGRRRA